MEITIGSILVDRGGDGADSRETLIWDSGAQAIYCDGERVESPPLPTEHAARRYAAASWGGAGDVWGMERIPSDPEALENERREGICGGVAEAR